MNYNTQILDSNPTNIAKCARHISLGGIVAFATETVYGLGASLYHQEAIAKIFLLKGRPLDNPLIVHIGSKNEIDKIAYLDNDAVKAVDRFMPGPLTLILKKKNIVPDTVTACSDTVAVRMPSDRTALQLISKTGPLCAPSANISTRPSATTPLHVLNDFGGRIKYILKSDHACKIGIESTVLDMTNRHILRQGSVSVQDIESTIGTLSSLPVEIEGKVDNFVADDRQANTYVPSPGTRYRHYAPSVPVVFVPYGKNQTDVTMQLMDSYKDCVVIGLSSASWLESQKHSLRTSENGGKVGSAVVYSGQRKRYHTSCVKLESSNPLHGDTNLLYIDGMSFVVFDTVDSYAYSIYGLFRELEQKYSTIIVQGVQDKGIGAALNNRLQKAAGL